MVQQVHEFAIICAMGIRACTAHTYAPERLLYKLRSVLCVIKVVTFGMQKCALSFYCRFNTFNVESNLLHRLLVHSLGALGEIGTHVAPMFRLLLWSDMKLLHATRACGGGDDWLVIRMED